jgi:HEAT repeat protein
MLREALQDDAGSVRISAAVSYWKVTGDPAPGLAVILPLLRDHTYDTMAVDAVSDLGSVAAEATPILIDMFTNRKQYIDGKRGSFARALGRIGPKAEAALPVLRQALKEKNDNARFTFLAAEAVWRISGRCEESIPAFHDVLDKGNHFDRYLVVRVLEEMGPGAKGTVPHLRVLLATIEKKVPESPGEDYFRSLLLPAIKATLEKLDPPKAL